MRCPNCHSIVGDNWDYCSYCSCDLREFRRDNGRETQVTPWQDYGVQEDYRQAYAREKEKNDQLHRVIYMILLGISLALNFIELLLLVLTNLR